MKLRIAYWFTLAAVFVAGNAAANEFAFGVKAGTLGLGLEGTVGMSEYFNARVGLNNYEYKTDETASDIRYDATLDLNSAALILDWHPFGGTFRLSAGLVHNKNAIHLTATPASNQTIGNTTYTPAEIGSLSGDVTFKKYAPFYGLGWGNAVGKGMPFGFNFEIGVVKQGKPKVSLTSSSGVITQTDLNAEAQNAENDLSDFDTYPVIALGFSYRF